MNRLSACDPLGKAPAERPGGAGHRGIPAAHAGLAAYSETLSPAAVLALQRSAGNAAVGRLLARRGAPPAGTRARPPTRRLARDTPTGASAPVTPVSGPSLQDLRPRPPATVTEAVLGKELADKLEGMVAAA